VTASAIDFVAAADPLLRDAPLTHVVELAVLGHRTRFETNSRHVATLVSETFGTQLGAACARDDAVQSVRVRIVVHEGTEPGVESPTEHAPVRHICPDATRVVAHSPGSLAVSDPARREAVVYATTTLVADRDHFRDAMLEAITFSLLTHFDRHPVHAAGIASGHRAVLLAGPSGSGKSTLSYLAHRAGLRLLSDDRVWLQLAPSLRVWGWRSPLRLLPDASASFPELRDEGRLTYANGKRKLAVDVGERTREVAVTDAIVCVLEPGEGAASLEPLEAPALAAALTRRVDPGFDRYPARGRDVVRALAERGGWRLRLSADAREALPFLLRMLDHE
jgi:hypothetical protein